MRLEGLQETPIFLSPTNILLRGSKLRNTRFAVGLVVYSGRETKIMMNATDPPSKRSFVERRLDYVIIFELVLMLTLAIFPAAVFAARLSYQEQYMWYLELDQNAQLTGLNKAQYNADNPALAGVLQFFTCLSPPFSSLPLSTLSPFSIPSPLIPSPRTSFPPHPPPFHLLLSHPFPSHPPSPAGHLVSTPLYVTLEIVQLLHTATAPLNPSIPSHSLHPIPSPLIPSHPLSSPPSPPSPLIPLIPFPPLSSPPSPSFHSHPFPSRPLLSHPPPHPLPSHPIPSHSFSSHISSSLIPSPLIPSLPYPHLSSPPLSSPPLSSPPLTSPPLSSPPLTSPPLSSPRLTSPLLSSSRLAARPCAPYPSPVSPLSCYFVPISLYVTMEIVKLLQAVTISMDLHMYYEDKDIPALARTSNINEELGMVRTVLSDKTGTLTRNQMEFFKCSIAGTPYGMGVTEVEKAAAQRAGRPPPEEDEDDGDQVYLPERPLEKGFNMRDPRLDGMKWVEQPCADEIRRFLEVLSVCHTVVVDTAPIERAASSNIFAMGSAAAGVGGGGGMGNGAGGVGVGASPGMQSSSSSVSLASGGSSVRGNGGGSAGAGVMGGGGTPLLPGEGESGGGETPSPLLQGGEEAVDGEAGDGEGVRFLAESPDEAAFVVAAKRLGFLFLGRQGNELKVREYGAGWSVVQDRSPHSSPLPSPFPLPTPIRFPSQPLSVSPLNPYPKRMSPAPPRPQLPPPLHPLSTCSKRMSVVVRTPEGRLLLLCKGADNVIMDRLSSDPHAQKYRPITERHMTMYAEAGLRTLAIAWREVGEEEYTAWQQRWVEAKGYVADAGVQAERLEALADELESGLVLVGATAIEDKLQVRGVGCWGGELQVERLEALADELESGLVERLEALADELESGLVLVGATAIEDKLQSLPPSPFPHPLMPLSPRSPAGPSHPRLPTPHSPPCPHQVGVPQAIEALAQAGIKLWVLTGDKLETAINIGFPAATKSPALSSCPPCPHQVGVPQAIEALAVAGIKLWVLTGDKLETAINIGFACSLLRHHMQQHFVFLEDNDAAAKEAARRGVPLKEFAAELVRSQILAASESVHGAQWPGAPQADSTDSSGRTSNRADIPAQEHRDDGGGSEGGSEGEGGSGSESGSEGGAAQEHAVVIDGKALALVLADDALRAAFLELALQCASVICCRVSPKQKAQVTAMVRREGKQICLAIGDGANDVGMIQKANIGVGIRGEEGQQAVMASDFAIGQFRFLERLLLVHGGWCYKRICILITYFFYKCFVFAFTILFYNCLAYFSGTAVYYDWYLTLFMVFFTSLPIGVVGVMDQDVKPVYRLRYPQLYKQGQRNEYFSVVSVASWMVNGLVQAAILFTLTLLPFALVPDRPTGLTLDLTAVGTIMYAAVVTTVNLELGSNVQYWNALHFITIFGSILFFFLLMTVGSYMPAKWVGNLVGVAGQLLPAASFWLNLLLAVVAAMLPSYAIRGIWRHVCPGDHEVVQEIERRERRRRLTRLSTMARHMCAGAPLVTNHGASGGADVERSAHGAAGSDDTAPSIQSNKSALYLSPSLDIPIEFNLPQGSPLIPSLYLPLSINLPRSPPYIHPPSNSPFILSDMRTPLLLARIELPPSFSPHPAPPSLSPPHRAPPVLHPSVLPSTSPHHSPPIELPPSFSSNRAPPIILPPSTSHILSPPIQHPFSFSPHRPSLYSLPPSSSPYHGPPYWLPLSCSPNRAPPIIPPPPIEPPPYHSPPIELPLSCSPRRTPPIIYPPHRAPPIISPPHRPPPIIPSPSNSPIPFSPHRAPTIVLPPSNSPHQHPPIDLPPSFSPHRAPPVHPLISPRAPSQPPHYSPSFPALLSLISPYHELPLSFSPPPYHSPPYRSPSSDLPISFSHPRAPPIILPPPPRPAPFILSLLYLPLPPPLLNIVSRLALSHFPLVSLSLRPFSLPIPPLLPVISPPAPSLFHPCSPSLPPLLTLISPLAPSYSPPCRPSSPTFLPGSSPFSCKSTRTPLISLHHPIISRPSPPHFPHRAPLLPV
ncbi:unnamed protein product [Closterium sp. Naga37s-1]|nr:unnamed protein product [Closterium sp. Naga37s-1]